MTIAVVDTGIDPDSPEFAGRLSPASTDIVGSRSIEGPDDHGTLVSLVAAAARDNSGILGIAFDSTILAIRADAEGSCTANGLDAELTCEFFDSDIASSIDYAVANDAKVINISLGGAGGISNNLRNSITAAVDAGVLIVVAAGNDGAAQLDGFGEQFANAGNGGVLIVGSVDADYQASDFSNRAGDNPQFYLSARGERICCVYRDGEIFVDEEGFVFLFSGTSFAAPQVAGAAALLAQAFPHLTGREIAEILLESAFDAGASGPDAIYGRGILDIAAAFQPSGTTSIAGERIALSLGDGTGVSSPAMGDAFARATLPTLITDRYQRAFSTDLASTLRAAEQPQRLRGALASQQRVLGGSAGTASVAFTIDATRQAPPRAEALQLTDEQAAQAEVLAARVAMQIAPQTQIGVAYRQDAGGLVAGLQGQDRPAFMIAGNSRGDDGMLTRNDAAFALRQQMGQWGLTVSAQTGSTFTAASVRRAAELRGRRASEDVTSFAIALDRRFGSFDTALGLTMTAEDRTILGGRMHEGFGLQGANTVFGDVDVGWRLADRWRLGAAFRQGMTDVRDAPLVADDSRLLSNAWSIDLERTQLFSDDDRIALRFSQPLRVADGGLNLRLPSSFSYETLTPDYTVRTLLLSPEGRELVGEVAWRGRLWGGSAAGSLFYRHEPGHFENAPADIGVAIRWSRGF